MAKFAIQGLLVQYYEEKEIEADTEDDATIAYYNQFKEGKLEIVNTEWEISRKEEVTGT